MAAHPVPNCIMCNVSVAKFCSACHSISYCSVKCQKADWPLHKQICKVINNFTTRPSPTHRLAMLLPHDSDAPQLLWIECHRIFVGTYWDYIETKQILNPKGLDDKKHTTGPENRRFDYNWHRKFHLGHTIKLIFRDSFALDGSSPNACVRHLTKNKMGYDWRGPILLMRVKGESSIDPIYEDVMASDLRTAVDDLIHYKA